MNEPYVAGVPGPVVATVEVPLTAEDLAGLRYWHGELADFDSVRSETGADLVALIDRIARIASS